MEVTTTSFEAGGVIPDRYAFAKPDPETRVTFSDNVNPHLSWSGAPDDAKSFVVVCHDYDVPSRGDDVNQPDREVPEDLPRVDFYHWLLIDLPADHTSISEGEYAEGVVPHGKSSASGPHGTRQGVNDFTGWFSGDPEMDGTYHGYDGPAPPWNDSILHHYRFTVYALDIEEVDVADGFQGADLLAAIEGHVLDSAWIEGTYTQNPRLR